MSRCFPFPPPGYEKKTRSDQLDSLAEVPLLWLNQFDRYFSLCCFLLQLYHLAPVLSNWKIIRTSWVVISCELVYWSILVFWSWITCWFYTMKHIICSAACLFVFFTEIGSNKFLLLSELGLPILVCESLIDVMQCIEVNDMNRMPNSANDVLV